MTHKEKLIKNIDEVCDKFSKGMSIRQISKDMNIDRKLISKKLKKLGLGVKNIKEINNIITIDDELTIVDMYKKGQTPYKISEKFNCSYYYIEKILAKYKIINFEQLNIDKNVENIIYDLYFNKFLSRKNISNKLNICKNDIIRVFLKNDWKFRKSGRKAKFNHNIFNEIDSYEKAYWLGFIFGDGYNAESRNSLEITLAYKDKSHLYKFKKFINGNDFVFIKDKIANIKDKKYPATRFHITSKQISMDLAKLGCVQNKSLIVKYPNINNQFNCSFIAGYFDANGCISGKAINIDSGSYDILSSIANILIEDKIITRYRLSNYSNSNGYVLSFGGKEQIKNFYNYLYRYLPKNTPLERKIFTFNEVLNT